MSNSHNHRISSQKAVVISTAIDLTISNVLPIVLYELSLASLHKVAIVLFWIGIDLKKRVSAFFSLLLTDFTVNSNAVLDILKSDCQKPLYTRLWRFSPCSSNQYSSLGCASKDLFPCAGRKVAVANISFCFLNLHFWHSK